MCGRNTLVMAWSRWLHWMETVLAVCSKFHSDAVYTISIRPSEIVDNTFKMFLKILGSAIWNFQLQDFHRNFSCQSRLPKMQKSLFCPSVKALFVHFGLGVSTIANNILDY